MTYNPQATVGAVQNYVPFNALTYNTRADVGGWNPLLTPVTVQGYISPKTIEHYVSYSSDASTYVVTAYWALYSLQTNGSQWASAISTGYTWHMSRSQLNGLLLNQITAWGTYTMTPGVWGVAMWGPYYGTAGTSVGMATLNVGNTQYNGTQRLVMANGANATSSIPREMIQPMMGVYTASTLSAPATINITEMSYADASGTYVVPYVGIRMAT